MEGVRHQLWVFPQLWENQFCTELSTQTPDKSLEFSFLTAVKSSSTPALKCLSQRSIGEVRGRFQLKIPYSERLLVCFFCKCGSCIVRISIFTLIIYSETKILIRNCLR